MQKYLIAAVSLLASAAGQAAPITLDDFGTLQSVIDTTANDWAPSTTAAYAIDDNFFTRRLSVEQIDHASSDPQRESRADIGFGSLRLSNAPQTNSIIRLTYDVDALYNDLPAGTFQAWFTLGEAPESGSITIAAFFNHTFLLSETYTSPGGFSVLVPGLAASGNELRFEFSGSSSFDATLGPISAERLSGEVPVLEPGALGLLGLGVAAMAFARRRITAV